MESFRTLGFLNVLWEEAELLRRNTVLLLALYSAVSCKDPTPEVMDKADGTYEKLGCPSFTVTGETIEFEGNQISGELYRIKGSLILETKVSLRYFWSERGCELVIVPARGALNEIEIRSGKKAIKLFSRDLSSKDYWTRS